MELKCEEKNIMRYVAHINDYFILTTGRKETVNYGTIYYIDSNNNVIREQNINQDVRVIYARQCNGRLFSRSGMQCLFNKAKSERFKVISGDKKAMQYCRRKGFQCTDNDLAEYNKGVENASEKVKQIM